MKTPSIIRISPAEITPAGKVTDCSNLRLLHRPAGAVLAPAPALTPITGVTGTLLAEGICPEYEGSCTLRTSVGTDGLHTVAIFNGPDLLAAHTLDTPPLCAMWDGSRFLLMTPTGPVEIFCSHGEWIMTPVCGQPPHVRVECHPAGSLSARTAPVELTGVDFSRTDPAISSAGVRDLGHALSGAYTRLAATASAASLWIAPVIVRYHLLSPSGQRLYTSAPMVMAPDGWTCDSEISVQCAKTSDTAMTVPAITLSAQSFRLSIDTSRLLAHPLWRHRVAAVAICVTPQLHAFDPDADMPWRITRMSTSAPMLSVALPGSTESFASTRHARAVTLSLMAMHIDRLGSVIDSFAPAGSATAVGAPHYSPEAETAAIRQALRMSVTTVAPESAEALLRDISPPNSFIASAVAANAHSVVWGDITPITAPGRPVSEICSAFDHETSWQGVMRVTMRDGSRRSSSIGGDSDMPLAWNPMVSHPHPDAVSVELFIKSASGSISHGIRQLAPSPDGLMALCVDQDLEAVPLTPLDHGIMPSPDTHPTAVVRHSGSVAGAPASSPLSVASVMLCSHQPVVALSPAVRSRTAWDSTRSHFYAFTSGGIYTLSLDRAHRPAGAALIDTRILDSPRARVYTPHGVMALCSGALLRIEASRTRTLAVGLGDVCLGWSAADDRLWLADRLGNLSVRSVLDPGMHHVLTPQSVQEVVQLADRMEIMADGMPHTCAPQASGDMRPVRWRVVIDIGHRRRLTAVCVAMTASRMVGSVTVDAGGGAGWSPMLSLALDGSVNAPVSARLRVPIRRFVALTVEGHVSADFALSSASFTLL